MMVDEAWVDHVYTTFERARAGLDHVRGLGLVEFGAELAFEYLEEALRIGEDLAVEQAFEDLEEEGWEEVSEDELDELIAMGAQEVSLRTDAVEDETRQILTGPRGGRYYVSASGRKVYVRKTAAAPAKTKPTAEEVRKARNERARARRAEKKAGKEAPAAASELGKLHTLSAKLKVHPNVSAETQGHVDSALRRSGFERFYANREQPTLEVRTGPGLDTSVYNRNKNSIDLVLHEGSKAKNKPLPTTRGKPLQAMLETAADANERLAITAAHEFGHAVHLHGKRSVYEPGKGSTVKYDTEETRRVDAYVQSRFAQKDRLVSRYGDDPVEWFAESYAAYHHSDKTNGWLKDYSPVAYETVEQVKKMRGMQ